MRQLASQVIDNFWSFEDTRSLLREDVDTVRTNRVNYFTNSPEEEMFHDSNELLEAHIVLDADVLEALHWIENLHTLSEERSRVVWKSKGLFTTEENESLIR